MQMDVEQAMVDYGEVGFNCFESPDFFDGEPLLIFYKPELLRCDGVQEVLEGMPTILASGQDQLSWEDGLVKVDAYRFFFQEKDARYLELSVLGAGEWECVLQCVAPDDFNGGYDYADMYNVMHDELVDEGILFGEL